MTKVPTLGAHLDGRSVPSSSGAVFEDRDPATGELLAYVARGGVDEVEAATLAAERAFPAWAGRPAGERADLLDAVADRVAARAEELALLESRDTGKPLRLARELDIPRAVANFRFFAGAVRHAETPAHRMPGALNYTQRRPLGVVGLITPWNLPLYLLSWKLAPALGMGNTVVAKPSELTPLTASTLADIFASVGAPPGIVNIVHGFGGEAGEALCASRRVRAISFTGGTATGARVAAVAAPGFKKLSLELGGKNPTVVFADADFDRALEGTLRAAFTNQGQICLCGSRVIIERSIYSRFAQALAARAGAMRVGDPRDSGTELGALISQAHRDKVERYLALAIDEGGAVRVGGRRPVLPEPFAQGAFLTPAVIEGLGPSCRTVQEEIFGPVVTLHPFDSEEEAMTLANGVTYGLSASVWTRDLARAHRVSEALEVGMVWVNTWLKRDLRVPFGGSKQSGVGREGGRWSLEFFSEDKNICIDFGGWA